MNVFMEKCNPPKFIQEKISYLKYSVMLRNQIIKNSFKKIWGKKKVKPLGPDGLTRNTYQAFNNEITLSYTNHCNRKRKAL